jgi:hypothetical protein
MDKGIVDRRRLLQWIALGSVAVPAIALAGCVQGGVARPPRRMSGGGNRGGEKGGGNNGGGPGGAGSR